MLHVIAAHAVRPELFDGPQTFIFYHPGGGEALLVVAFVVFLIVLRVKG